MKNLFVVSVLAAASGFVQAQTVNVICSVQAEWCNMIGTVYAKTTGTKINISMKGSGESLAQLIAEKTIPRPTSGLAALATHTCRPQNPA